MDKIAALHDELRRRGFFRKATARVVGELALHVLVTLAGAALFVVADHVLLRGLGILVASLGSLGVLTNTHTASHYAASDKKWVNELLLYFGYPFFGQLSATYWCRNHKALHHPGPNTVGRDCDIDLAPWFAYTQDVVARSTGLLRLYYKLQGVVFPFAAALNGFNAQLNGWCHVVGHLRQRSRRKAAHWVDLLMLVLHGVVWFGVPLTFLAPVDVLIFNVGRVTLLGYLMFGVVAPAHFPAEAACLGKGATRSDFVLLQTATTLNYRTGFLGRLLCSGAEYQIEHHLFPGVSHVYLPAMSRLVEEFCRRNGYPYRRLGWAEALWKSYLVFWSPKRVEPQPDLLRLPSHTG